MSREQDLAGSTPAEPAPAPFAGWYPAGRAQWIALAGFTVVAAIAAVRFTPVHQSPLLTTAALVVAVAAAASLVLRRRPQLLYAAVATAGIAVLADNVSSNVGWFAICLLIGWCVLTGGRPVGVAYWAGVMILFAAEWLWTGADPGWLAWLGGASLTAAFSLLVGHQRDLVAQLREAQAGLAEQAATLERNRISRELHDIIGHTLTVSLLHVQSARLAVEHDPADAARALAEAERLGRECLAEVRLTMGMLRQDGAGREETPGDAAVRGDAAPLPGADGLPALVERFRSAGANISLTIDGDIAALPATAGLAVYRITQEALTNAVKHAPGAPTAVRLTVGSDAVTLTADSSAEPGTGAGLGVISMRERAESLGGSCQAGPGGQGWLVRATLPLDTSLRAAP